MAKIRFGGSDAAEIEVEVGHGESLADALRRTAGQATGPCRGHGRCGMCMVAIEEGAEILDAPGEAESRILRLLGASPSQRLACQARGFRT